MRGLKGFEAAAALLPRDMRQAALALSPAARAGVEELRLRTGQPLRALSGGGERSLGGREVGGEDLSSLLEAATHGSAHTALAGIRAGFVPLPGGCRLGLCGEASVSDGGVLTLRRLSSAAIRIAHEAPGCAAGIEATLLGRGVRDTLIVSPPGAGKTTLLRELIRLLSTRGRRVAVADERGEIAGVCASLPAFDLGPCADVMTGAPKAAAAEMLIRAMAPEVLAMDEITSPEDTEAALFAAGCGVKLLATAHAEGAEALRRRPLYRRLLDERVFELCVTVRRGPDGRREYTVGRLDAN